MDVEHNVLAGGEVSRPEWLAFETTLQHDGDLAVDGLGVRDDGFEVLEHPCGAGVGEGGGGSEMGEVVVVDGFVDGSEGVGLWGVG